MSTQELVGVSKKNLQASRRKSNIWILSMALKGPDGVSVNQVHTNGVKTLFGPLCSRAALPNQHSDLRVQRDTRNALNKSVDA